MPWVKLCHLDDVPARQVRSHTVQQIEMVVVRGDDGHLVIPPLCPHMASALADGFFDGRVLTCSTHLWQWTVPAGQPIGQAEVPLLKYESQIRDGEIWVNLDKELVYDYQDED